MSNYFAHPKLNGPFTIQIPVVEDVRGCLGFIEKVLGKSIEMDEVGWYGNNISTLLIDSKDGQSLTGVVAFGGSIEFRDGITGVLVTANSPMNLIVFPQLKTIELGNFTEDLILMKFKFHFVNE